MIICPMITWTMITWTMITWTMITWTMDLHQLNFSPYFLSEKPVWTALSGKTRTGRRIRAGNCAIRASHCSWPCGDFFSNGRLRHVMDARLTSFPHPPTADAHEIGSAHVCTPVTNANPVHLLLLEQ